jgi:anthranilate phosphoribosyltransferase
MLSKEEARKLFNIKRKLQHVRFQHLTVYMMRSISIEELAGFREALLELCIRVDLSAYNTVDLCGTGGDGKDTFNIST